ncbi:sigma-70 family RNA polymerase sigma factor [Haloimpatiens lingqiaonensis]|uniref:sigma-70 family RNA polymerase sigma factor n=1 Tax=Haloimpatiens lingqiaonensis TaxID=1380675 RepID=UPI0010FE822E|nr:sigma-70 family RNA polymerase sigma factor [Haloimpatiens lingqiaonensis]
MTNEELVCIYQEWNSKEALNQLIKQNMGIIYKLANRFYIEGTNSIDKDDLIQEGVIGLMKAAKEYKTDVENSAKFITYAVYWIYAKMNRYMRQKNTNEETSLNIPVGENSENELLDTIEGVDYGFENIEDKIYRKELREELNEVMHEYNTLREMEVLKLHYGWDNNKNMTFNEIGEVFDITGQRVRTIEAGALRKLRNSPWGKEKAKKIYVDKKEDIYSINDFINVEQFKNKYLDEVIGG